MISSTLVLDLGNEVVIPLVPFVSPIDELWSCEEKLVTNISLLTCWWHCRDHGCICTPSKRILKPKQKKAILVWNNISVFYHDVNGNSRSILKKKLKLTQRKITNCKVLFTANENAFTLSWQTAEKKGRWKISLRTIPPIRRSCRANQEQSAEKLTLARRVELWEWHKRKFRPVHWHLFFFGLIFF